MSTFCVFYITHFNHFPHLCQTYTYRNDLWVSAHKKKVITNVMSHRANYFLKGKKSQIFTFVEAAPFWSRLGEQICHSSNLYCHFKIIFGEVHAEGKDLGSVISMVGKLFFSDV